MLRARVAAPRGGGRTRARERAAEVRRERRDANPRVDRTMALFSRRQRTFS
jgi:hypothetical protein